MFVTFDTCAIVKILEHSGIADWMGRRFGNSVIHVSSEAIREAHNLGYGRESVYRIKSFGLRIEYGPVTDVMRDDAKRLEAGCPTLHDGDSRILAYARATDTELVTFDRGLAVAAKDSGSRVVFLRDRTPGTGCGTGGAAGSRAGRRPRARPLPKKGQKVVWGLFQ